MGLFSILSKTISSGASKAATKAATTPAKKTTTAASVVSAGAAAGAGIVRGVAASIAATTKKTNTQTRSSGSAPQAQPQAAKEPAPAAPAPPPYKPPDTDIVTWSGNGGISFFVKPTKVQGVSEISIEASANTEDKEEDDEKLAKKKTNGSIQITMRAILNAYLGADVQGIANKAIEAARRGDSGYLYSYGKKLFTCAFIMADAKASNILMSGTGTWISCDLSMTLKQTSKAGGSTMATGGGGSGGGSSGGGGGGGKKTYSATVYYSASSGAVQSVTRTSTVSQADAEKKAWAAVPSNAQWASLNPKQATNQQQAKDTIKTTNDAKKQSQKVLQDSKRTTLTSIGTAVKNFASKVVSFFK